MACPSSLEFMPRELIWPIIEHAPESVAFLRLSCSTLRAHVDQYALERTTIRLVDELYVTPFGDVNSLNPCVHVSAEVCERMANLFELRLKLRSPGSNRITRRRIADKIASEYKVTAQIPRTLLLRVLCDAMGTHIGKVALAKHGKSSLADIDEIWGEGKSFPKLTVTFENATETNVKYVQNLIIACKVEHMTWHASKTCFWMNTTTFLSEMAANVRTLYVFRIETLGDIPWAPLIQKMMSKKLDKLHLSTTFDKSKSYFEQFNTISADCAAALIDGLPKIRKRFHFSIAFKGQLGVIQQQRPFICRIREPEHYGMNRMLIISHWSRIDEPIV